MTRVYRHTQSGVREGECWTGRGRERGRREREREGGRERDGN